MTKNSEQVFEWAMKFIMEWEGGFVDDDEDPGGETNFGISQYYHPDVDVETLTRHEAIDIYRERYWKRYMCDELNPALALALFDTVVNQPADWGIRSFQNAVSTTVDGIMGPKTVGAANKNRSDYVLQKIMLARLNRYITRDHFKRFGDGWMRRVLDCYATCRMQL